MMQLPPPDVNINQVIDGEKTYIQVGLEMGQHSWEMTVNSPMPGLFNRTYHHFKGSLDDISQQALCEIEIIATEGHKHNLPTLVVYEAGGFGQEVGRNMLRRGARPIQLVARHVEYVNYGRTNETPKTDSLDSQRQSELPLYHSKLPYADVQSKPEEELRMLYREHERLSKQLKRINSQMCSFLRCLLMDVRHGSVNVWRERLERLPLEEVPRRIMEDQLALLSQIAEQRKSIFSLILARAKDTADNFQPPNPEAQGLEFGRHGLQALGENSPLRAKSLPEALLEIGGIGSKSMLSILALVGNPRRFKSKKAFRSYMGLAPIPRCSCTIKKTLGMKHGSPQLRKTMVQLAWRWCSLHPDNRLSKKYSARLLGASRRSKKIAVCALAGELAEMLYNYLVRGREIDGLQMKTA